MAKKAQTSEPSPAPQETPSKMDAVRTLLGEKPDIGPKDIVAQLKSRWGLDINEQTASSYKSQIKSSGKDSQPSKVKPKSDTSVTLDEMLKVKQRLKDSAQTVDTFLAIVAQAQELEEEFGSLGRLVKILEAIKLFSS